MLGWNCRQSAVQTGRRRWRRRKGREGEGERGERVRRRRRGQSKCMSGAARARQDTATGRRPQAGMWRRPFLVGNACRRFSALRLAARAEWRGKAGAASAGRERRKYFLRGARLTISDVKRTRGGLSGYCSGNVSLIEKMPPSQGVSSGPKMVPPQTCRFSSPRGLALTPSGGFCFIVFRSLISRRLEADAPDIVVQAAGRGCARKWAGALLSELAESQWAARVKECAP